MVSPEILRRYPFFGTLSDTQIKAIAMIAEEKTFEKGTVICEEGKPATAFYLLLERRRELILQIGRRIQSKITERFSSWRDQSGRSICYQCVG